MDACGKDQWRMTVKNKTSLPTLPGKWLLNVLFMYVRSKMELFFVLYF